MPKENILSTYSGAPKVEVSWAKQPAGHVQVATLAGPGETLVNPEEEGAGNGWYATLDRDSINRLIRSLRKARDQAYGADA